MAELTKRFVTSGMHCSSCSMLIDITLADLEGIVTSRTDHATGISEVTFDDEATDPDRIVDAIRSAGYEAELDA